MSDADDLSAGDIVEVTNIDGDTATGTVIAVHDDTVAETAAEWMDADDATLEDFWRGHDISPDERVVAVNLSTGTYDYPESKVERLDDAVTTTVENRSKRETVIRIGSTTLVMDPKSQREVIVRGSD